MGRLSQTRPAMLSAAVHLGDLLIGIAPSCVGCGSEELVRREALPNQQESRLRPFIVMISLLQIRRSIVVEVWMQRQFDRFRPGDKGVETLADRPLRLVSNRTRLPAMSSPRSNLLIINQTQNTVLCSSAMLADTALSRLFGLLGQPPLSPADGLLIKPSSGVHTWGMTFPIDIIAVGLNDCVVGVWRAVGPWRVCGLSFKTRSILELAPGAIDRSGTLIGDQLHMLPVRI